MDCEFLAPSRIRRAVEVNFDLPVKYAEDKRANAQFLAVHDVALGNKMAVTGYVSR